MRDDTQDLRKAIHIVTALDDAKKELARARSLYPDMRSPHEGWAIMQEEMDELWDHVRKKDAVHDRSAMREEAIQIAAMALRFAVDLCIPPAKMKGGLRIADDD